MRNRLPECEKKGYRQDFDPVFCWSKTLKHFRLVSMGAAKFTEIYLKLLVCACCALMTGLLSTPSAYALPSDFLGSYEILDSRRLSISGGAAYVIQDGQLVVEISRNRNRPYCRALQSFFDESEGTIEVRFSALADGSERAVLKTVPAIAGARPTTIECNSEPGFFGSLDLSVALGLIVRLSR
ncbi:MAG: hypothetical protein J0L82_01720 [Deltaproteobacteria bacterium]|nr:hypothetical protein [Deltaproteobacteria bacterium]